MGVEKDTREGFRAAVQRPPVGLGIVRKSRRKLQSAATCSPTPRFKNKEALKLRAWENFTVKPDWRNSFDRWLRGLDLNQRPLGYEPNELPDCSTPRLKLSTIARSGSFVGCL